MQSQLKFVNFLPRFVILARCPVGIQGKTILFSTRDSTPNREVFTLKKLRNTNLELFFDRYSDSRNFWVSDYLLIWVALLFFFFSMKNGSIVFFSILIKGSLHKCESWVLAPPPLRLDTQSYFISAISDTLIC